MTMAAKGLAADCDSQGAQKKMKELIQKYNDKAFGRDLLIYQNKILKLERKYPCDYVARYPKYLRPNPPSDAANNRNNALKNVIMRIIINIRDRRKRPKLSDFIAVYREKKNEKEKLQRLDLIHSG